MKNKYQEVFAKLLINISPFVALQSQEYIKDINECMNELRELVDKETPMKPLVKIWDLSLTDEKDILCPKCNALFGTTEEYWESNYCCDCGQKLDWSDE